MALLADERAQSIQVGAVLLFAILILAFSTYQAVIVPDQNRRVEFDHNQEVQSQLGELRDDILASQADGSTRSTTVDLGTRYPSRAIAMNPSPPSGTLRTVGTTDPAVNLTIANATAGGETGDHWDGSTHHFNTGGISYDPAYQNYDDAPRTGYEHTVLYNAFDGDSLVLANQSFIEGTDVSLVTINGSLERTSSTATTVDTRPLSSSDRTITVSAQSNSSPITLNFTSQLTAERWNRTLSDQEHVENVTGFPSAAGDEFTAIRVTLNASESYDLELTKAGVGTGLAGEDPAYLTAVAGSGPVERGNHQEITLEVRDAYNNPVRGVNVSAAVGGTDSGSVDGDSKTTGSDGRVTFTYRTTGSTNTGTHAVNFTTNASSVLSTRPFDDNLPTNATLDVTVTDSAGGGAGLYSLSWTHPGTESENSGASLTNCGADACAWDVGASDDDTLTLNATLDPPYEGIGVEYAVDDSTVAGVSPNTGSTGSDGAAQTVLTATENGTVDVLASANEAGDSITVTVENVTDDAGQTPTISTRVDDLTHQQSNEPSFVASYDVSGTTDSFERVDVTFEQPSDTVTQSRSTVRGGVVYTNDFGSGASYDITFEAIYTDESGTEFVATSTTVSDTADAVNPSGNDDLSETGSAQLSSWTIQDRTQTNQNRPLYRFTYDVTTSGSFSDVRIHALNLPGSGESGVRTLTDRSQNNQDINLNNGANDQYRIGLLVRDGEGVVVDSASVTDNADGTGTLSGP